VGPAAGHWRRAASWLAVPAAVAVAGIPFTNLAARVLKGVDLRDVGTGTVSGTGLYQVAGFGPLAVAGVLEVAKGAVGPLLAGTGSPALRAAAAGAAVAGHNWSPWLGGAGGRGLSPAIGALGVTAPAAAATVLAGLAGGRLAGDTAMGSLVADVAAVPVARRAHGDRAAWAAAAVVVPIIGKRLAGNQRPATPSLTVYAWRLLYDRDTRSPVGAAGR
jgi:glycerol-3-phosphate acyltransferase PlsY